MIDAEREILIHASDLSPDPDKMRSLLSPEVDGNRLVEGAIREGLGGLLYRSLLKSNSLGSLQPMQRAVLENAYYRTVRSNLILIQDLKEVLHELNQRKIRVVLLQGMDLLHSTYDDIGLRPLTDVDVWVRKEDYPAAVALLGHLHYGSDPIYPTTFRKGSTTFDLHTQILWADRIRSRKRLLDREDEEVFAKIRQIAVEGEEAFCLNPYDQFIYLGLHTLKHRANRLMWLVDLNTIVGAWEESDWQALSCRAKEMGQEKTVSCILYLLRKIFHAPLPDNVNRLPRLGPIEKKILEPRIQGNALTPWGPAFLFSTGKGLVKGLPIFLESLFPRPEILRQMFPESSHLGAPWLCFKRTVQLLGMLSTTISPQRTPRTQREEKAEKGKSRRREI